MANPESQGIGGAWEGDRFSICSKKLLNERPVTNAATVGARQRIADVMWIKFFFHRASGISKYTPIILLISSVIDVA